MIEKTNPLLDLAVECLALKMKERPSAKNLCRRLEEPFNNVAVHLADEDGRPEMDSKWHTTLVFLPSTPLS